MSQNTAVATRDDRARAATPVSVFSNMQSFEEAKAMCGALVNSVLVPESYRGNANMGNAMIALDMANRMRIAPIMVMQNLDIIEGRPSWKSQFIIAAINSCGLFSPLRFNVTDHGEQPIEFETWGSQKGERVKKTLKIRNLECRATAIEKATGEVLDGPPVSIAMAVAEGWYARKGSKWQTMPELMLRYRAAAFFGRLYAPHLLNGMPTADEAPEIETDYEVRAPALPAETAEPAEGRKPGRSRGVDAALKRAEAARGKGDRVPAAPPVEDAEIVEEEFREPAGTIGGAEITGDDENPPAPEHDDPFDAPGADDDEDYQPA